MQHDFSWAIDGTIVGLYLVATMVAGLAVRRYVGKVEHFLVAGREVNVYLGIASLAATEFGVITCMYTAQNGYQYGFAGATPGILMALAMFFVGLSGFCIKPLRDAGVMTIPELFEKRYGPRVRWAAGLVIVLGGLLNMGVFLRITGEFLLLVCGLRIESLQIPAMAVGGLHVPAFQVGYLELIMTVLLLLGTIYTVLGGMLSVLVTDFLQFIVMSLGLIAVTILILAQVGWEKLAGGVAERYGAGGFNPWLNPELGWPFVIFNALLNLAAVLTWQTTISRLLSAKDARTGRQIYTRTSFFFVCRFLIPGIWGIAALVMIASSDVTAAANCPADKVSLMAMPVFLSRFVPVGLMGLLLAAMLAADMSSTSSYMITWGSVIYNDILAPFRKTPWSEKRGLRWNRVIVALIGVFLLVYGLWYPLQGAVWDYLTVTGTIYLASISTLLVACCYWKRANNWGAIGAILLGAVIPIAYLIVEKLHVPACLLDCLAPQAAPAARQVGRLLEVASRLKHLGPHWWGMAAFAGSAGAMIVGSLLKPAHRQAAAESPTAGAPG